MLTKTEVDLTLRIYALKADIENFAAQMNELLGLIENLLLDNANLRAELANKRRGRNK